MKTSYLNNNIYRLITPPCVAILVYLLMLLIFDRLTEISNNFSPEELIFLIAVTAILFESYRFWLLKTDKIPILNRNKLLKFSVIYTGSFLITAGLVYVLFAVYYRFVIGISEFSSELVSFLIIFILVGILFHLFYLSIRFLDRQNSLLLEKEELNRKNIEFELEVFKNKLNPDFLYESLESVISLIRRDQVEGAEEYIDHLALFYRRILGNRYSEIITLEEEKLKIDEYLRLRNYNYSDNLIVNWALDDIKNVHVVPNMILQTIQLIEYSQQVDLNTKLEISIKDSDDTILFRFLSSERLTPLPKFKNLKEAIQKTLAFYTDAQFLWERVDNYIQISIPKINIED
ncbi:histidine kinase [Marinifilum flexuosum]|uniref:Histidine kinase n=1 Tax=Marinifilum flexuosum TaxID=1117708 RepID=A0A419XBJ2_9BACT|nr:histidine kinase [Marinifilum flexuosum]RKE04939.1 histidine kinase [Marinifilum flexuosum]